jgi:DNA-binding NarL/FixJ family response regulator
MALIQDYEVTEESVGDMHDLQDPRMNRKRILIADDHASVLEEVRRLLQGDYEIVGAVPDGKQLVETAARLQPDLIITDISMPEMTGFEAISKIKAGGVQSKVIFLTVQSSPAYLKKARSLGANGYVLKVYATEQLRDAITAVINGETYISPELVNTPEAGKGSSRREF